MRRLKSLDYWKVLKNLFKRNAELVILDVGAYNGNSIHQFKKLFPKSTIHSFEPTISLHEELEKVCKNYNNVFLYKYALSDCTGKATLYTTPFSPTNSLHPQNLEVYKLYNAQREEFFNVAPYEVDTVKLDDWIQEHNIKNIDILKTDTQAHDYAVLRGGGENIPNIVKVVVSELHFDRFYDKGYLFFDICQLMYEYGFKLMDFCSYHYHRQGRSGPLTRHINKVLIECDGVFYNPKLLGNICRGEPACSPKTS